jgi:hypothetical protein
MQPLFRTLWVGIGSVCILTLVWQIPSARPGKVSSFSRKPQQKRAQIQDGRFEVKVTAVGGDQALIDATSAQLLVQPSLQGFLQGDRYRLLSFELIDSPQKDKTARDVFRAVYYNYSRNQQIVAQGRFSSIADLNITVNNEQPLPSNEEYDAALAILLADPKLGPAVRSGQLLANPAMPPVIYPEPGTTVERTLNILLLSGPRSSLQSEVVGINMVNGSVVRFPGGAPPTSKAAPTACGIPNANQATTSSGTPGQFQFTITQNGTEVWSFLAIRPSNSSGQSDRSGIELQDVKYKGKMVLKRMHAPILNVNYDGNVCGPFRDWQWQEGMFQADGTDVPGTNGGVRDCGTTQATTALDTATDMGNFRGIAFYREGNEVILVSEMNAGWYRYICEYGFDSNGTIRPRYGYGATQNNCVCAAHTHHVYWRFDFDIGGNGTTPANNVIRPSRREFLWGAPYTTETRLQRGTRQNWLVQNLTTLDSYMIRPNSNDGTAAAGDFGRGDLWLVLFKAAELSDRTAGVFTGTPANLDAFVNGESVMDQDIVVWYGGHFYHDDGANEPASSTIVPHHLTGDHVQGPDLVPVRW